MSSWTQNDSVIDDDDELCPLCIEEFDLSDKNFKPCPCGYQICQFCYNNIKTHSEEGRCPNCRRVYDESTIQYRVPDADEFKADLALKHRKAAAAKKKEAERREIEASSRKNLAGVRVVQKNLVYVIGLNPTIRDENQLLQTLRGEQYFGQYGDIDKIVVSKAKPGGNANQGIGVYVTFARKADAATCIAAVDGAPNGERVLRAQYGTTKYCSSFLRNEQCNNRNCTFLHETGEDTDSFSRQDLSSMNTMSSQRTHGNGPVPSNQQSFYNPSVQQIRPAPHVVQPPVRQNSKDEATHRFPTTDGPALPSSASWANKDAQVQRARRSSLAASRSSPSPRVSNAAVNKNEAVRRTAEKATEQAARQQTPAPVDASASSARDTSKAPSFSAQNEVAALDNLIKAINSPGFRFVFSSEGLSPEDLAYIENHPSLIDPYGGAKRRAMREKAERDRAKQESDSRLLQTVPAEDENLESGSSQLGGEPEDVQGAAVGRTSREPQSAIQPPSHQATAANSTIGSPVSAGAPQFQGLNAGGRGLTPQQQQQLMLLKSVNGQQMGLMDQPGSAFDQNAQLRAGLFQNQMPQMSASGHARQSSRFSFANDANAKNAGDQRILNQQPSVMQTTSANPLNTPTAQQGLGNHFFTSVIQGPPPGLKTAGTPPISGGGMFAQGHGFTSTMNNNLGLGSKPDGNAEAMREFMRGRSGTSGVQGHEAAKREFMFPFLQQLHSTPPPLAPVSGLLNSFYGHQTGSPRQEQGPGPGLQKQKKRGKKHRHANTSSGGGGGVVDLADPSILQARMHQGATAASATAAQGLYGSQGQDEDFPPLGPPSKTLDEFRTPSRRAGTPSLPPGLPLPHAHPTPPPHNDLGSPLKTSGVKPVQPPIPLTEHGVPSPMLSKIKAQGISRQGTPDAHGSPMSKSLRTVSLAGSPAGSPRSTATPQPALTRESRLSSPSIETAEPSGVKSLKENRETPRPKPIKLNLSLPAYPRDESPSKGSQQAQSVSNNAPSSAAGSRPNTPGTTVSRASDPSQHRQARVLRVVDTPKSETPPLQIATGQSAAAITTPAPKQRGRKPSVSSISRSETPVEVTSEYDPFTSASASRANSPPPSRVGSAPVRTMTKSQVKKERKLKAKKEEAKKEESLPSSAVVEEPVQAPIIGRKRKTKKPSTTVTATKSTEQSQDTPGEGGADQLAPTSKSPVKDEVKPREKSESSSREKSNERKDELSSEEKVTKSATGPKKDKVESWHTNNTLEQLLNDADATGASIKDLLLERTTPLHVLLGQLHQSGDLDLNTHPLFNPPNITQRFDMKCTAEDYDMLKRPIELTEAHRKQLLQGKPVRIQGSSGGLKDRCLITPTGCVLRHLTPEEEDRYLELEKSLVTALDSLQEYPPLNIPEPDVTNRGGGLDALFAAAEKFNIRWVDAHSPSAVSDPVAPLPTTTTQTIGESIRSMLTTSAPTASTSASTSAGAHSASAALLSKSAAFFSNTGDISTGDIADLMNMSGEELEVMIQNAQRELEGSRREVEVVDKKVMGLVKRNRKLVQQALAVVGEAVAGVVGGV